MPHSYSSAAFEAQYTYPGTDLGAVWAPNKTRFRLWAPTAENAAINLYLSGTPDKLDLKAQIPMEPDAQGTWIAEVSGDLNGLYYTYLVTVDGITREACDPYARSTGVNGQRGMILDLSRLNPEGWESDRDPHAGIAVTDAVIYELHVRDLSMNRSGRIRNKGKFAGVTETGTATRDGHPTGIDHIRSLGITHLHLLPLFDFGYTDEARRDPQFNWGYDPVNFNVPEGSYASDPYDGAVRVREMKQMVKDLHDLGISVVMDVVYNHVYDAQSFCFNQIVPGYFSRQLADGTLSNGSCCGNDTASERSMVRKYIVDSVNYWVDEYHIDGFRFDLVGLIDIQTINEIVESVHRDHPNVLFYGEGWQMASAVTKPDVRMTVQENSELVPGFAFFSDTLRDLIRGSVFDNTVPGFATGALCSRQVLDECFMGMPYWAAQPSQCVNYVSCHDNNTLFDRITLAAPEAPLETRIRMNDLAASFTFLSQGIPFLQAGEELLRTKPQKRGIFDHNSFRSPDRINSLKWNTLSKEDYQRTLKFYQGLVAFRKAHPVLRLTTRQAVSQAVKAIPCSDPHCAAYHLSDNSEELYVLFNSDTISHPHILPPGQWQIYIREEAAGTVPMGTLQGTVEIPPISALVLARRKPVDVVAALIWEKDKFLICQRPANKARGLLWEFVGGKVEPGETLEQALVRECREELDIPLDVGNRFMQVNHEYPDIFIRLTLFHCTIPTGTPKLLEHNQLAWIHPSQVDNFTFCPADTEILARIKDVYGSRKPL